jgi:uncharacterized membrane protein YfcA
MFLFVVFFIVALVYACAGFGGGSTYNAVLILNGTDYRLIPFIALSCNIIVVSCGTFNFLKNRHVNFKDVLPWIALSIPAAWIGGSMEVSETVFLGLLGSMLFLSGIKMLWPDKAKDKAVKETDDNIKSGKVSDIPVYIPFGTGAVLGATAGITGIGGGIFLAPVLYWLNWGNPKKIAGTCSLFILVNSIAGLIGHWMKLSDTVLIHSAISYWSLWVAVLAGGQIGSWLGASRINFVVVKNLTAFLILYVSIRILYRLGTIL